MNGRVSASLAIYNPEPDDMRVYSNEHGGLVLHVHGDVWFTLADKRFTEGADGLTTEAKAMRKLAELASAAAEELERRRGGAR